MPVLAAAFAEFKFAQAHNNADESDGRDDATRTYNACIAGVVHSRSVNTGRVQSRLGWLAASLYHDLWPLCAQSLKACAGFVGVVICRLAKIRSHDEVAR